MPALAARVARQSNVWTCVVSFGPVPSRLFTPLFTPHFHSRVWKLYEGVAWWFSVCLPSGSRVVLRVSYN